MLASVEMLSKSEQRNPQRVIGNSPEGIDNLSEVEAQIQTERGVGSFLKKIEKKYL